MSGEYWVKIGRMGQMSGRWQSQLEAGLKSTILDKSNLFEGMNFRYFGPIDVMMFFTLLSLKRPQKAYLDQTASLYYS